MGINLSIEQDFWRKGLISIAGIDEAGRGPLAGPVVASAVIFHPDEHIEGINDSKKISAKERERLFDIIMEKAVSVGIGASDHAMIDRVNILNATFHSMHEAVEGLSVRPDHLLVDGPHFAGAGIPHTAIIGGDAKCFSIAAASIVAKISRDRWMIEVDSRYPGYGFAKHKGYGTPEHIEAIKKYGLCGIHRRSFHIPGINPK